MQMIDISIEREIMELITSEDNSEPVNDAIAFAVKSIQDIMDVSQLPQALLTIMNMWVRTDSWYLEGGVSKFEFCLKKIVTQEMMRRVYECLIEEMSVVYQMPNDVDLCCALNNVSHALACGVWSTMDTKLTKEALRWIKEHDEHVMDNESEDFMWIHPDTGEECYHLKHLPKPEEHDDEHVLVSLEMLPNNFQHETDWTCPICLEVGEGTTCVRTGCEHVFHKSCFDKYKNVYLEQDENDDKTCCPCPLCRANIN